MKRPILATILILLSVAVLLIVSIYGFGFLKRATADFRGETDKIEQTKASGDYRIASYDHFFDTCASIQSIESKIINMEEELESVESEQRKTVLNTSITASKNKRADLIASYNADARKEATRGQFRASDLPYEINENEEETICEAY